MRMTSFFSLSLGASKIPELVRILWIRLEGKQRNKSSSSWLERHGLDGSGCW